MAIFYTDSGSFNNLEITGSTILSGSLIVSGATNFGPSGLTGSLFGSSSFATTSSAATSITFTPLSSSFATTASAATSITFIPESASYALTASYAANGGGASLTTVTITTPSIVISPTYTIITSGAQHLETGMYAMTAIVNNAPFDNHRLTGTFAWISSSITSNFNAQDEIFLHRIGGILTDSSLFMRTSVTASTAVLEIASDVTLAPTSYTFTMVKLI